MNIYPASEHQANNTSFHSASS